MRTLTSILYKSLTLILLPLFILSCTEEPVKTETILIEKTVTESVDSAAIIENDTSIAEMEDEILGLTKKNDSKKHTIASLHEDVKELQTENDSLKTTVNQKNNLINKLMTPEQEIISDNELRIRSLVQNLNIAWSNLTGAENTDELTGLFLPKFAVSMVSIDMDDQANVRMMLPEEFFEYANKIRKIKDASIQIGNINFLYFEGREGVYSVVYSAVLRVYREGVAVEDKNMVATLTVKKLDDKWKIGKYTWVTLGQATN